MVNFNDYLDFIKNSPVKQPIAKIQWLYFNEQPDGAPFTTTLIDGTLQEARNNGIRRTVDLTLANIDGVYIPDPDGVWIYRKFKLWLGFNINGEEHLFEKGVFVVNNPDVNSNLSERTINIHANDKYILLDKALLTDIFQIPVSSDPNAVIKALLTNTTIFGANFIDSIDPILDATSEVTPYTIRKLQSQNVSSILTELQQMLSRNTYYDVSGAYRYEEDIEDNLKASVWDFNFDTTDGISNYIGSVHTYDFDNVVNRVRVISTNVDGVPVIATAENNDPLSPTNIIDNPIKTRIFTSNIIQTQTLAQKRADYELRRFSKLNSSIQITCAIVPHINVDDAITVTDSGLNLDRKRFIVQNISTNVRMDGTMTITAVESDDVTIVTD